MLLRVLSLAAGTLVLFASLIIYLRFTRDNARGERSLTWPTTPGRITQSRIRVDEHRTTQTDYIDIIEYEYMVDGRVYRGGRVDQQIRDIHDRAAMRAFIDSYPKGKEVVVHYDSANPEDAMLVPGPAPETAEPRLLAAKIMVPVGALLILWPWLLGYRPGRTPR